MKEERRGEGKASQVRRKRVKGDEAKEKKEEEDFKGVELREE